MAAKILLKMIEKSGASRTLSFSVHCPDISNFTNIPLLNLNPYLFFIEKLKEIINLDQSDCVIIAPDLGSIMRCKDALISIGISFALIHKGKLV